MGSAVSAASGGSARARNDFLCRAAAESIPSFLDATRHAAPREYLKPYQRAQPTTYLVLRLSLSDLRRRPARLAKARGWKRMDL
jgi:hypothetical protein